MFELENQLKNLLLNNVEFKIDNKIIKKGRIRMFNTKQFFIKFKIENNSEFKDYELPYPFRIENTPNGFIFDYCLSAFVPKTEESYWRMKTMNQDDASKIHEKYLHIIKMPS